METAHMKTRQPVKTRKVKKGEKDTEQFKMKEVLSFTYPTSGDSLGRGWQTLFDCLHFGCRIKAKSCVFEAYSVSGQAPHSWSSVTVSALFRV